MTKQSKPKFTEGDLVIINGTDNCYDAYYGEGDLTGKKATVCVQPRSTHIVHIKLDGSDYTQTMHVSELTRLPKEPTAPMTVAVLEMLRKKGSITGLEAGGVLKCRMLPFQIFSLRKLGWSIKTEYKLDPSDGQKYGRYHLLATAT